MRALLPIAVLTLALAGCSLPSGPATPATSGVTANGDGSPNMNGGGAVRSFTGRGGSARLGAGGSVATFQGL